MRLEIQTVNNGYILTVDYQDGEPASTSVFEDTDDSVANNARSLLNVIVEELGVRGGRYDKERLYVVVRPGDKNEAFTEADAQVIFG